MSLEVVTAGLTEPVAITHAGDQRLFVSLKAGRVLILEDGRVHAEPFLDIEDRVRSQAKEQGLGSIAFHPDYPDNGLLFATYTARDGATVISRFKVSEDPDVVRADSEVILLRIEQPAADHNGGQLHFGPDRYLYFGGGDGGGPNCNSQSQATLLGKMLRLDVDQNTDRPPYFGIPPDNPYVGPGDPPDEVWAKGFRNPWRFSFDRLTGDLYIADVGAQSREEVSFQPAASGGGQNYGWRVLEGTLCIPPLDCDFPLPPCDSPELTPPILEYDHSVGCAIIGGYVYRGPSIPDLVGFYLYGDYCAEKLWAATRVAAAWQVEELGISVSGLTSFGEDRAGELYLAAGDTLYRLIEAPLPGCVPDATTLCLHGARFAVDVRWRTSSGAGVGTAVPLTEDSGYFWFFDPANPEVFVKVIDACVEPFQHFWVFAAGLTDVETHLEVVDKASGQERRYEKPLGEEFVPVRDTSAFDTCP